MQDGITSFAPDFTPESVGYDAAAFARLAPLEATNFWFRSRNRLITWALREYFPTAESLLEVGCGTGFVLAGIADAAPSLRLYGSEILVQGLDFARARVDTATFMQMDARRIPFQGEFDVIGAFDVLEHIREDQEVLERLYRAVRPGGGILLTVPQHPFLWSAADDHAHHVRRYTRTELGRKVTGAGFTIRRTTSFVSLLLPLMLLSRVRTRVAGEDFDPVAELKVGGVVNRAMEGVMSLESVLIRRGISLPAGGSLLLVASRPR